ncbi:MAG: PorV/PorQ family protein [Saprospiraceae bacterium]|nr:PorV/PorQ family protein [Saprospiraceae bacterium]
MKGLLLRTTGLVVLALSLFPYPTQSQCLVSEGRLYNYDGTDCRNTVFTAVPFLRMVADARSGAMGDAGIATSTDANAMQFNASKLAFAKQGMGFGVSYMPWLRSGGFRSPSLTYLSGFTQLGSGQALGFGVKHLSLGAIPLVNTSGTSLNNGETTEVEFALAYAKRISGRFSAAITGKFIYSNLAEGLVLSRGSVVDAETVAALDLSFTYQTPLSLPNRRIRLASWPCLQ